MSQKINTILVKGINAATALDLSAIEESSSSGFICADLKNTAAPAYFVSAVDQDTTGNFYVTFLNADGNGSQGGKIRFFSGLTVIPIDTAFIKNNFGVINMVVETDNIAGLSSLGVKLGIVSVIPVENH